MDSVEDQLLARAAVVDAARALLAGHIGLIEASRVIAWHRHTIDPAMDDEALLGFVGI